MTPDQKEIVLDLIELSEAMHIRIGRLLSSGALPSMVQGAAQFAFSRTEELTWYLKQWASVNGGVARPASLEEALHGALERARTEVEK